MSGLIYILIAIFILGIAVIIHELGHFLVGKKLGFAIEEFGIGFGPKIYKRKGKTCVFSIGIIPLGGFVRFLGEDEDNPNDPRAMNNMPWWKRLLTLFAGAGFNILSAMVVMFVLLLAMGNTVTTQVVDTINPQAPLAQTQLQPGDEIVAISNVRAGSFDELKNLINEANGKDIVLTINRDGLELQVPAKFFEVENNGVKTKMLGLTFRTKRLPIGVGEAVIESLKADWNLTKSIFQFLGQFITGKADLTAITGPVSSIGMMSDIMQQEQAAGISVLGTATMLFWAISINVGLFNLLPIPALDGCRMLFVIIERIRRKPVKRDVEAMVHFVGFVCLMTLVIGLEFYRFFIMK